jgi:hypothetical protein
MVPWTLLGCTSALLRSAQQVLHLSEDTSLVTVLRHIFVRACSAITRDVFLLWMSH